MTPTPCRVHILLARKAKTAVAIRRGPSKRVCTVAWDRRTDRFQTGQWLKGRLYERRSDLSPDGKHLIYFALNGRWKSPTKGSWTAVSRAPYLKALGLWANGSAWNGGGLFTDRRTYWLNIPREGHEERLAPRALREFKRAPFPDVFGDECPGVYYLRLQRDGWRLADHRRTGRHGITRFEKPVPGGWILEKSALATIDHPPGKGVYHDTHALQQANGTARLDCPGWEWADLDGKRLVWVEAGILHAARLARGGIENERILFDFNPLEFEEIEAPY